MINQKLDATGYTVAAEPGAEAGMLDDRPVMRLFSSEDAVSIARLAAWLKANARTASPIVTRAIQSEPGLSPDAAGAVLDAMVWGPPSRGETTLGTLTACLNVIASRLTQSLGARPPRQISDHDEMLVGSAVATLTSKRPAKHSETAIGCLADAGPGGALVLTRAFDAVRGRLKLRIVQQLKPVDVLQLDDNVVVSLAHSIARLAEEVEGSERAAVSRFLAELGSVQGMEPTEIGIAETLEPGDRVFHASWGVGTVVTANNESATIDFGSAGTRTLLRALATLRRS